MNIHEQAQQLAAENGGHWGEHPAHPADDWQQEVANGETRHGYWYWVANEIDTADERHHPHPHRHQRAEPSPHD